MSSVESQMQAAFDAAVKAEVEARVVAGVRAEMSAVRAYIQQAVDAVEHLGRMRGSLVSLLEYLEGGEADER